MRFYVYELIDPRTGAVFYVGKGQQGRIHQHEVEARKGRLSRKCDCIRSIWAAGYEVSKRKVKSFDCEQAAYDFEEQLIEDYGLPNLTNLVHGGKGGRSVATIKGDRDLIRAASGVLARCSAPGLELYVFGRPLGLASILQSYKDLIGVVVQRRGLDWVNQVAARHNVVYSRAPNI